MHGRPWQHRIIKERQCLILKSHHFVLVIYTSESNLVHILAFSNSEVIYLTNVNFICLEALEKNSIKSKSNPLLVWVSVSVSALLKADALLGPLEVLR